MKKLKIYQLIFLLTVSSIYSTEGSVYSRYGLGDLMNNYSARRVGLGGLGIALSDANYLDLYNPAGWNELNMTRFEIGLYSNVMNVSDNASDATLKDIRFSGFMIGIPVQKDFGISLVGGLIPYSSVSYNITHQKTGEFVDDYTIKYSGSGGLSKFFIGTSYRLPYDWSLGFAFEYYTGKIDYNSQVLFDATSYDNSNYQQNNKYRGSGFNMGVISGNLSPIFDVEAFNEFRLGATFNTVNNLKTDNSLIAISSLGSASLEHSLVETKIPDKVGIGASFRVFNNYNIIFDYVTQDWTKYTVNKIHVDQLNKLSRLSFGFEYKLHDVKRLTTNSELISWRGGLSFETSQYKINGQQIKGVSVFAGVSYPLEFGSSVDLGLEYTSRGTTDYSLLKENYFKVYFSMSIGELWFMRNDK